MAKSKNKAEFSFGNIMNATFEKIAVPLTKKELRSTIWARFAEILTIGIMWLLYKINPAAEKRMAAHQTKKWSFKPIPLDHSFSEEAIKYKEGKTIDINKKFDVETKILDITTFNEIAQTFPFTDIGACGCRTIVNHCDNPTDTCLMMRWAVDVSKKLPEYTKFQKATQKEVDRVIEIADKHALIRMTLRRPDPDTIYTICNCCDCCCISFHMWRINANPIVAGTKFVARIDPDKCKGCYHCVNYRCRFRAIMKVNEDGTIIDPKKEDVKRFRVRWPKWSEKRHGWGLRIRQDHPQWEKIREKHEGKGKWYSEVDPTRCFGCGNCASPKYGCPEDAIKLFPRENNM